MRFCSLLKKIYILQARACRRLSWFVSALPFVSTSSVVKFNRDAVEFERGKLGRIVREKVYL